jgi:hypothetical protein
VAVKPELSAIDNFLHLELSVLAIHRAPSRLGAVELAVRPEVAYRAVESDRVSGRQEETDRVLARRVETDRVLARRVETDRVLARRAETDRVLARQVILTPIRIRSLEALGPFQPRASRRVCRLRELVLPAAV